MQEKNDIFYCEGCGSTLPTETSICENCAHVLNTAPSRKSWNRVNFAVNASIVTFLVSLALPGLIFNHYREFGIEILFMGWIGAFDGTFSWFANPLLALSLFLTQRSRPRIALSFGIVAIVFALSTFALTDVWNDSGRDRIREFGPGIYVWLLSFIFGIAAAAFSITALQTGSENDRPRRI